MEARHPEIAIVGAGRMGLGIAHVFAYNGYKVALIDAKERDRVEGDKILREAARQITANLEMLAEMDVLERKDVCLVLERITYVSRPAMNEALAEADVIFEAVPEVLEIKKKAFADVGSAASPDALIASTTSTFLVDILADLVAGPERFMTTHWLNPAFLIPLVEVSPSRATSPESLDRMMRLLTDSGKVPVKVKASPGFIVPRIQALAMNEAARLAEEGVASVEDIDQACRVGFGLRFAILGLLEFIDWGGGDILFYAGNYLAQAFQNDRFLPPAIISENMRLDRTGMKTGLGFYDFKNLDISAYQKETIKKFVDLLEHLGFITKQGVKR